MSIKERVEKEREKRCEELGQIINDICDLLEFYGVDEKELDEVFEPIKEAYGIFPEEVEIDGKENEDLEEEDEDD